MHKAISMLSRRSFVACMGATAAACGLSACTSSQPAQGSAEQRDTTQVIVAMNTDSEPAAGFDPLVSWGCGEHVHEPLIQSTLITTNTALEFEPDLATHYECSADGLVWTFELRSDVVFSDGKPLTASDVAFTINSVITSDASEADLSMVREAVALNDTTVELHMVKPYNALLYTLAVLGIVPQHAYDKNYGSHPVGSGPYVLERWDKGQQAILRANPQYYGTAPTMQRVVVVFMAEDAALAAAQAGQVDIAYTYATHSAQKANGYSLLSCKSVDSRGISLPCIAAGASRTAEGDMVYPAGNNVTAHRSIRQAINYALDRSTMIDHVLSGYGKPAYSVSDGMPWSSDDMKVSTDLAGAKRLLADDGWTAGSDGILQKDGLRASCTLWYASTDSVRQALANEVASQLTGLGIEVTCKGGSWDEIYPHQYEDPVLWGWGSNSPVEVYELNYSSGWGNYACRDSSITDSYLDEALAQTDVDASWPYWKKAQWDGTEGIAPQGDAPWVWLVNVDHLYFKRNGLDVGEQKPHPHGYGWSLLNNVDTWRWEA